MVNSFRPEKGGGMAIGLPARRGKRPGPRALPILFFSLFVVMIGFGIAMAVVPFFAERLVGAAGIAA